MEKANNFIYRILMTNTEKVKNIFKIQMQTTA